MGVIDEKHGVGKMVFLVEFTQKQQCSVGRSGWEQSDVKEVVCSRVDGSVRQVVLAVELNHGFVDRNVIRSHVSGGLEIGAMDPVVNGVRLRSTPNLSRYCLVFESDTLAKWS